MDTEKKGKSKNRRSSRPRKSNKENNPSPSSASLKSRASSSSESSSASLYSPSSSSSNSSSTNESPRRRNRASRRHGFAKEQQETRNGEVIHTYHCNCGKKCTSRKGLVGHIRKKRFRKGKIFQCPRCPSRYSQHRTLKRHAMKEHEIDLTFIYGCNGCGKSFKTFEKLNQHRNLAGHPVIKLGKAKVGPVPPPSQPLITNFFKPVSP